MVHLLNLFSNHTYHLQKVIMSLIWVLWALGFYDPIIPMIRVQRKESSFNQTRNLQLEGILWSLPSSACIFCFQSSWTQTLKPHLETKIKRPLLWHCSDWLSITLPNTIVVFVVVVWVFVCVSCIRFSCLGCCALIYGCADVGVCSLGVVVFCCEWKPPSQ